MSSRKKTLLFACIAKIAYTTVAEQRIEASPLTLRIQHKVAFATVAPSRQVCYYVFSYGIVKLKAQRFRVAVSTVKDAELASAWSETNIRRVLSQEERQEKKSATKKKGTRQERDQQLQEKTIQLQQWLSDIHAVKYCSKKSAYYVRCVMNGKEKTKLLERKFIEESVLLLDEEFIDQVKKNKSSYHEVTSLIKENVKHRAELWAGSDDVYNKYNECLGIEEWTHLMVNYGGNGVIPQDPQRTMRYIQSESEFTDEAKDYSISLQNEAKKKKITYVPMYYMFVWKVVVSICNCQSSCQHTKVFTKPSWSNTC